jgi:hypothetical protein
MLVSQIHLRLLARYIQDDRLVMRKMDAHQRVLIAHCPQAHMGLLLKLFPQSKHGCILALFICAISLCANKGKLINEAPVNINKPNDLDSFNCFMIRLPL